MESEIRRKIEDTVVEILSAADLEEITEFKARAAASERLGIDLSGPETKSLVRTLIENFLVSAPEPGLTKIREHSVESSRSAANKDANDRVICKLSNKRNVVVHDFRGETMVSIRKFYWKDGMQIPAATGISLSTEQWSSFKRNVPAIEEAIKKMESTLRPELDSKETEEAPDLASDISSNELRMEIVRYDGKNYMFWSKQMDTLLQQLKIAYVMYEPCPVFVSSPGASTKETAQSKAAEQRWKNDDRICCRNILFSLSDELFNLYSKKSLTAKELWEELKLVHLYEEFGSKRSLVKKYIEFQMVEERSIMEQVQEINDIADSVVAAGMDLEEKFHVSVVVSKLPLSWRDVYVKLMCEQYLPFWMLMNRLGDEEKLRLVKHESHKPPVDHPADNDDQRTTGQQKPQLFWPKKRQLQTDDRVVVCRACNKKGHSEPNCRTKVWRRDQELSGNRNRNNGSLS